MKVGDLIRNKNSKSKEVGIFLGLRIFKHRNDRSKDYTCAEVHWSQRIEKYSIGTIQTNLIEVVSE